MREILTTARLRLREMEPDDLDFVSSMMGDSEVMRHFPKVATRDEAAASIALNIERYRRFGHGQWLVEERETGRPIGRCGLLVQQVGDAQEREIGYMLHRAYWKNGFAAEAALGVRTYAFDTLGLPHVISLIRPDNLASAAVAWKLGMLPWKETMHFALPHCVWRVDRDEPCSVPESQRAAVAAEYPLALPASEASWQAWKARWRAPAECGSAPRCTGGA